MAEWDLANHLRGPASSLFAEFFNPTTPIEYIGNLGAFREYLERRGILRSVIGIFGRHISLASLVGALINLPILNAKTSDTIINDFVSLFDQQNARKTLVEWLTREETRARKQGRSFDAISHGLWRDRAFYDARERFGELDSKFVILEGAVCNKEHLRHNPALFQSASKSNCDWVLCDMPPAAMQKNNPEYRGELVFLKLDDGFLNVFGGRVPFESEIGWFPYCTVAGFLSTARLNTEHFPTLHISLLFQRRPISPEPHITKIASLLERERSYPLRLKHLGCRIALYYLVPSMYKAWGIDYEHLNREVALHVGELIARDREILNDQLVDLYETTILPRSGKA